MKTNLLFAASLSILGLPTLGHAALLVTGGHIDAPAFGYDTIGGFEPHIHNEGGPDGAIIGGVVQTTGSEYEPDELVFQLKSTVTTSVSGTDYFWLPEGELDAAANGLPFLGVGLEELAQGDWDGGVGTVTITASKVSGPGEFRLWQDDGFGGVVDFINTATATDSFTLIAGTHTHYNWGFTELGVYEIEFGISGNHVTDGAQSGSAVYTFAVPEPSTALLGVLGGLLLLRRRRG
ncbi:choice-of-anchor M domain-containing protein [Haloferula sp. A504]|uniref:choice-of-anchor M domain-containing protein n=1 Tax=Haloferula sp. A504 TaxID=3373601 RepID=UPI0031BD3029|nr:choice-of-anchor M domain-containing protein [Verrucomicrobiaceae bacterium E54]